MNLKIKNSLLIGLLLLVTACGKGGSGGSTTNTTDSSGLSASHTADTGCIDRSSAVGIEGGGARRVLGVITSIGSDGTLVVGCLNISTADAVVEVDGKAGTLGDLQVGQVVEVIGSIDPESGGLRAERITTLAVPGGSFAPVASMSAPRSRHTATLLPDGQVLIVGGDASAELYDPADATFVPTGSMSTARVEAAAVLLKTGNVLVAGGYKADAETGPLPQLASAELYDSKSGGFALVGSMHEAHIDPTATLLTDGRVLIAGGTGAGSGIGKAIRSAEIFDPETFSFTSGGQMMSDRAGHAAVLLTTGEVLIVGGRNGYAPDAPDDPPWDPLFAELFDPTTGQFTVAGQMSTTRLHPTAMRLPNGKVLVLGGFTDFLQNIHEQPTNPAYAEVYDRASRTFFALRTPRIPRRNYTATLLNSGWVLLAGGEALGRSVDTVQLLDPVTGSLINAGHLTIARLGHTATLLKDGRVLVTGGTDSDGDTLVTAEMWTEE